MKRVCCFAGHGDYYYDDEIRERLLSVSERLITEENVAEFWVGNYGAFDRMTASELKKLKPKYPHIEINLCLNFNNT